MNIINKIYDIMTEYDRLLNEKENNLNIPNSNSTNFTETEINKNKEECYNDMDNFFKYIFKNINVENLNNPNSEANTNSNNPFNNNNNSTNFNYNNKSNINTNKNNSKNNTNINNTQNNSKNNDKLDNKNDNQNNKEDNKQNEEHKNNKQNEEVKEQEEDEDENERIISDFIKKIYKKIVLKCHPDKGGDKNLFVKCKEYYDNKFIIGILYIGFIIKYELPELNTLIINKILFEIRVIQEKIIALKLELKRK